MCDLEAMRLSLLSVFMMVDSVPELFCPSLSPQVKELIIESMPGAMGKYKVSVAKLKFEAGTKRSMRIREFFVSLLCDVLISID
jgi:hypothetical protein